MSYKLSKYVASARVEDHRRISAAVIYNFCLLHTALKLFRIDQISGIGRMVDTIPMSQQLTLDEHVLN